MTRPSELPSKYRVAEPVKVRNSETNLLFTTALNTTALRKRSLPRSLIWRCPRKAQTEWRTGSGRFPFRWSSTDQRSEDWLLTSWFATPMAAGNWSKSRVRRPRRHCSSSVEGLPGDMAAGSSGYRLSNPDMINLPLPAGKVIFNDDGTEEIVNVSSSGRPGRHSQTSQISSPSSLGPLSGNGQHHLIP